jgi:dihydroorotase
MPKNHILIRSARLLHPDSSFHQQQTDILIAGGTVVETGTINRVPEGTQEIDAKGWILAPGFFDLNTTIGEPGQETSEDLDTGTMAAAAGGYTGIALMPNSPRPAHSGAGIAYLINRSKASPVTVYPVGSISQNREGKDLAELYDMHVAGAVAFSDGDHPVSDAGLLSRAMQYVKSFGGRIFSYPEDRSLAGAGKMNEGETSTYLGMKGIPCLAEEIMVARDIYLAEYNDAPLHFSAISTAGSVKLIREAKARRLKITCDVAAHHLLLDEKMLEGFDSNYKVKPPLRTHETIGALLEGLRDGTIDAIVSQHTPREKEYKDVEFEIAAYGIIALQTVLPALLAAGLSPELIVEKLSVAPRNILGLPLPAIENGAAAELVLFDPEANWIFNETTNFSKSSNSPFFGKTLKGQVKAVFAKNKQVWTGK